jgi:hypothetical protein
MPASFIPHGVEEDNTAAAFELVYRVLGFARRGAGVLAQGAALREQFAFSAAADGAERIQIGGEHVMLYVAGTDAQL